MQNTFQSRMFVLRMRANKKLLLDKKLSQVYSTFEDESKIITVDKSSTKESESECVHKSVNKGKYANNEVENEETSVTDNPVVKEPRYFNIFECGENLLNNIIATCKRACMANSRNKYYTGFLSNIKNCNNRNDAPFSNEKIQEAIHKVIS